MAPMKMLLDSITEAKGYSFLSDSLLHNMSREETSERVEDIIQYFRPQLATNPVKASVIIKKALSLKSYLDSNNINPQLAIDNLLIFIFKTFRMKL